MEQKTGDEHFYYDRTPSGFLLNDFWRWHSSDLLNNTLRGALAEFIVAKALGIKTDEVRPGWEPYDLLFCSMWRIEVKASAYVQSWSQKSNSVLRFTIRPTHTWTPESGYAGEILHQSDMYIFCVLDERNPEIADPLILDQWSFYPALTAELREILADQKTAGLNTILRLCPERFDFGSLRDAVLWLMSGREDAEARHRIDAHNALSNRSSGGGSDASL
ncbi:MAG: hypothetical protein LBL73_05380 [Synergistaceae bacterium]|nr:hypothetical protein [Synergistaceae bacterium]